MNVGAEARQAGSSQTGSMALGCSGSEQNVDWMRV